MIHLWNICINYRQHIYPSLFLLSHYFPLHPDHLLSDTFPGQDCDSPDVSRLHNNNLPHQSRCFPVAKPNQSSQSNPSAPPQCQPLANSLQAPAPLGPSKRRLSVERSLSAEDPPVARGPEGSVTVKPARVYTITREGGMTLGGRGSEESLELEVLKSSREPPLSQTPTTANPNPSCTSQPSASAAHGSHHRSSHHRSNHHHANQHHGGPPSSSQPLQSSGNANNIRDWGMRRGGSRDDYTPNCVGCIRAPCQSQRSLDLDTSPRDGEKHRKKLERMYSEERPPSDDRGKERGMGNGLGKGTAGVLSIYHVKSFVVHHRNSKTRRRLPHSTLSCQPAFTSLLR